MTHEESTPDVPQAPTEGTAEGPPHNTSRDPWQHSVPAVGSMPWLYACPRCCAQSTTQYYAGPTHQQLLRKQHRPGCKSTYKVLIGQLPVPAVQLRAVTATPIARDQTSVLVLMLQRSEAAALLIRAAVRALNAAGESSPSPDLFLSTVIQQLGTATVLLSGSEEPTEAQYADFSGEKPRRLCNNCAQPASAHPVEITREGRRLVCVLRPTDKVPAGRSVLGGVLGGGYEVTDAGRAALSESERDQ